MSAAEKGGRKLETPREHRRPQFNLDSDVIGLYAERVARFLGTGRYLAIQTVIVIVWILLNLAWVAIRWDPYPFILLNLAFSTQAAYAAPLILLAQNRQENRDRIALDEDRSRAAQTKADTEFLARELASVRLAVGDTVTRDYLRKELDDLLDELVERLKERTDDDADDAGSLDEPKRQKPKSKKKSTKDRAPATDPEHRDPL